MGNKSITFRGSLLLAITCCMCLLASCGGGAGSSDNTPHGSGTIPLHLTWAGGLKSNSILPAAKVIYAEMGLQTVIANVYEPDGTTPVASETWPYDEHRGIIRDVPAGTYSVVVMGRDADNQVLYHAEATHVTVPAGGSADPVALELTHFMPTLAPPCNGTTLQWESVSNAVDYNVSISANRDMSDAVAYTTADTSYTPENLDEGPLYYWQVKANDRYANQSSSSEIGYIVVGNADFMFDISNATSGSDPSQMIVIGDVLYFTAYGQKSSQYRTGRQLYKYDGLSASQIIIDPSGTSDPDYLTEFENQLYFVATDNSGQDRELWKYNGTSATKIDINGTGSSEPRGLTIYQDSLYFTATVASGQALYRYNGTGVSPEQIYVFPTGSGVLGSFAVANDQLYISTFNGYYEPWHLFKFNGKDQPIQIDAGNLLNPSSRLTVSANQLYFAATAEIENEHGNMVKETELYQHDGTDAAPIKIDICSGTCESWPEYLTDVNGVLYFSAKSEDSDRELFKYNGPGSTAQKIDINPSGNSIPQALTNLNGTLYFSAMAQYTGREPFYYDGRTVHSITDIENGQNGSNPAGFSAMNGMVYFSAYDGVNGSELWSFNESTRKAQMVKDICPGSCSGFVSKLIPVDFQGVPMLLFSADNGVDGNELWSVSPAGTTQVVDLNSSGGGALPSQLSTANGKLYFSGNNGSAGNELWESDGTIAGTRMVIDLNPGPESSEPRYITAYMGKVYFSAQSEKTSFRLWEYNGASVQQITANEVPFSSPANLTVVHDTLYFTAWDGPDYHYEIKKRIYQFKGNTAATISTDIDAVDNLAAANGLLYFSAKDTDGKEDLYKYDGNILTRINIGASGSTLIRDITPLDEDVYFGAYDGSGYYLFKYNGSALQKIIVNQSAGSHPRSLTTMGGNLYCIDSQGEQEYLYKYDGESITRIDKPTKDGKSLRGLSSANDMLFIVTSSVAADNGTVTYELWKSDGTDQGTELVKQLGSYETSYSVHDAIEFNGKIYFILMDIFPDGPTLMGYDIWSSDGSEAELVMSGDFPEIQYDRGFIELGKTTDALFFTHYDPEHGPGLWKLCP